MGGLTGKCDQCGKSQHWDSGDLEIITLKSVGILSKFGVICHYCGAKMIIHDDFNEGPRDDDKWVDDNPSYQMDDETEGQYVDRAFGPESNFMDEDDDDEDEESDENDEEDADLD